ncbi:MAG: TSUP family transporter [Planctomycetes bacterium]|nr:TSUP family transporter [Planctomycetota bacterium]
MHTRFRRSPAIEPVQVILIALIIASGAALQSAVGFGFGLFATPLLLFIGLPAPQAVPTTAIVALVQTGVAAWKLRHEVQWRLAVALALVAMTMQPVGAWLLSVLVSYGPSVVQQVISAIVLGAVLVQAWVRPHPSPKLHIAWGIAAMIAAGLMHGLCGMSGPPVVLWVMAHDWSSRKSRAMMFAIFFMLIPPNLLNYYLRFGMPAVHAALIGGLFFPVVLLGMIPGMWIGHHLPKPRLKQIAFAILILIAAAGMLAPLMQR